MGADDQRRAVERALGRRPPVLRGSLLPRSRHGNGLHRREALGHPAAVSHARLPRGAHDPQPLGQAGEPRRTHRRRVRLRRPVRGQGRSEEEGHVLDAYVGRQARARVRPRAVLTCDGDLADEAGQDRQRRVDLPRADRPARRVDDRHRRGHGWTRSRTGTDRGHRSQASQPTHAAQPREMAGGGAPRGVRRGRAQDDVPQEPRRPRGAALLAADRRGAEPPRCRTAVVHDHVRPRQHLHEPAGDPVHARAGGDDAACARRLAGRSARRLPRRGSRPDPPRDALRRDDRIRGAAALAVLRLGRCDAALRRAARRVRALDGRPQHRARARGRGARGAELDRRVRGHPWWHRIHLVPAAQREDRPREPVLEGLLGLDLVPRRDASRLPASDVRAPGLRVRREGARRPARTAASGAITSSPTGSSATRPISSVASTATTGSRTASTSLSRSTPTGARWTRSASNNGHLLWSGIVDKSKAKARRPAPSRAEALLGLGRAHARRRRGAATTRSATTSARSGRSTTRSSPGACVATASRTRRPRSRPGILDAAEFFDGRLPEAFGGYERSQTKYPVQYPTACSPQAWSTGTPLLLLRTMLGLEPHGDHLVVDPALPRDIGHLELLDIPGRWGRIDAFGRGRVDVKKKRAAARR